MKPESKALSLITLLVALSAAARLLGSGPVVVTGSPLDLDSLETESRAALEGAKARARPLEPGERIDINTATADEIDRLPGVGPALARRIVADRDSAGAFRDLADLTRVSGIGAATAERMAPHLELGAEGSTSRRHDLELPPPASRYDLVPGSRVDRAVGPGRMAAGAGTVLIGGIDVNTADAATLQRLPGVGPVLARRIVAYREANGPFGDAEELVEVSGIGEATLRKMRGG